MRKKLVFVFSLVAVLCCLFALTTNAQCESCTGKWSADTGIEGYLGEINAVNTCSVCGTVLEEEVIAPLFETLGYSYSDNGGISQHIAVNRAALARYEEISGKKVKFGAVVATTNNVSGNPLDESGKPAGEKVIVSDFTSRSYDIFEIAVREIPADSYDTGIYCCMYIIVDGKVTYIDNCVVKTDVGAHSYNEIVAGLEPEMPSVPEVPSGKQNWEDDGSLKILTIGNSYSDDAMEYVYNIAKSLGIKDVEVANLRYNSCSLAMHLDNAKNDKGVYMYRHWVNGASKWTDYGSWSSNGTYKISQAVTDADWDFIVFQQVSTSSTNASTYDDLNELISIVEELNPTAKLAWHMTWGNKATTDLSMYNGIVSAVNEKILTNDKIDYVIPVGTAIQNARGTSVTLNAIMRNNHLGYGLGRYIAGLTFIKTLTGMSIDNISYAPTADTEGHTIIISDYEKQVAIESANNAVTNPYSVTASTVKAD